MSAGSDESAGLDPEELATMKALERSARLQREVLTQVRGPVTDDEARRVEGALREVWGSSPALRSFRWVWLIAAAVVVTTVVVWRFRGQAGDRAAPGVVLGPNELTILEPGPTVDGFRIVRWRTSSRGKSSFDVRVYDDASGELLLEARRVVGNELPLGAHGTSSWRRVRVEIDEFVDGDLVQSTRTASTKRGP
jgi:hypothetical protein